MSLPIQNNPEVTIIVPAYNEENSLPVCLNRALEYLQNQNKIKWELIIIDDGSTDKTFAAADDFKNKFENIRLFRHNSNKGMGAAYITGIQNANGKYAFLHPADGSFEISDCLRFFDKLCDGDFVIGRRTGYCAAQSSIRQWISDIQKNLFSYLLNLELKDFCGVNLLPVEPLKNFSFSSNSHVATIEAVVFLLEQGMNMTELSVEIHPRIAGVSKIFTPAGVTKAVYDLLSISIKRIKGGFKLRNGVIL